MKIWIDAQLSPAIAAWINCSYQDIEAQSIRAVGLTRIIHESICIRYLNY